MTNQDLHSHASIQPRPASRCVGTTSRSVVRSLALAASLSCLVPISLSAKNKGEEQDKHEKEKGKGGNQKHGKGSPNQPSYAPAMNYVQPQAIRSGKRGSYTQQIPNPVQFTQPQGTRENRYGGQWFPSSTHSDWDRGSDHYWGSRHYRWYDGGWLIISTGNNQGYERGYERGYVSQHSVARNVQRKLANQGYYNGPIDWDIGPGSRRAIMDYQDNNGLRATGRIDDRLLVSLGLE